MGLILLYLGNSYKDLKNYKKAENLIKQGLTIYRRHYGEDHIETAHALRIQSQFYIKIDYINEGETFTKQALMILESNNHPGSYVCAEILANLYFRKSQRFNSQQNENQQQVQHYKSQALDYLHQALDIIQPSFPPDSAHIIRIKDKIKKLESTQ